MQHADALGIRVIVDLVANHTSIDSPWFRSARSNPKSPFRDWYVWADERPANYKEGIVFPGVQKATWTYDKRAKAYYGAFRLVLGDQSFRRMDKDEDQAFVDDAVFIDETVRSAVAEHSLSPQNIEAAIRQALLETAVEVNIGFIAQDTLHEWRKVSVDVLGHPLTLERFIRRTFGPERREDADRFIQEEASVLVQRALDHVGEDRVREYLDSSMRHARTAIKEYLS